MKTTRKTSMQSGAAGVALLLVTISLLFPVAALATGDCDVDGDGSLSMLNGCGGDDCDDFNAARYPGNIEICDEDSIDEDCDLSTFGPLDNDGDGFVANHCCNRQLNGDDLCGRDCDDINAATHPGQIEVCNNIDDNCDRAVDEGTYATAFGDADNDGWGDSDSVGLLCAKDIGLGWSIKPGDCNDNVASIYPGAPEICNGLDNNCNGLQDDGLAGFGLCD